MAKMQLNISKRTIGLNFNAAGAAEILLWASKCTSVSIQINDTLILALEADELGYWYLETSAIHPGDRYTFLLQGNGNKRADPAALYLPDGALGQSTAFNVNAFNWTDTAWEAPELKEYIIYELHIGTFTPEGNLAGLERKLDYLIDLGITAIELMPVAQYSGDRNWGYDGVFPFAVQHSYGGPVALQHFVNACHEKGLAVILDVVYNHLGPEGNFFEDFGPYFTDKYQTPWGSAINFDDQGSDAVRSFYIENMLMWFRDFHIDALRLDAVHAIKDFSGTHLLAEMKEYTNRLMQLTGKKHYLIAESDLNDPKYIDDLSKNGYGIDAQWIDEFHHALRVAAGQQKTGYYEDFEGIAHLAKSYQDAYVFDGQYSKHRQRTFGKKAIGNRGDQFIVFSQNHDQVGNRMLGERSSKLYTLEMQKLLAGAVFCSPFIPLLFMGEEWGVQTPFQFFCSFSDPGLIEAVRKGRKEEFSAFHQSENVPDPQDVLTFECSKLDWATQNKQLLAYYKDFIRLRKRNPVLAGLNRTQVKAYPNAEQKMLHLERWNGATCIHMYLNFSNQVVEIDLAGAFTVLMDSAIQKYGGPKPESNSSNHLVFPESILMLSSNDVHA